MVGRSASIHGPKRKPHKYKHLIKQEAKHYVKQEAKHYVKQENIKQENYYIKHEPQSLYQNVLVDSSSINSYNVSSNAVNFHNYAMNPNLSPSFSPVSSPSPDTSPLDAGKTTTLLRKMQSRKRQLNLFDPNDKEKQHHHNQLERNRRQKLADLFTDLRDEVPKIQSISKASKVVILNEATDHITELQRLAAFQEDEMSRLLQKQLHLEKQLRTLSQNIF